jgi:hypothetical protein
MARKRPDDLRDYESDYLQSYLDAFVQESVALPAPIQNGLAKIISQAYAGGQRGTNADIGSMPFPTSDLIQNPSLIPQTIGDAERLLARSFYPSILRAAKARSMDTLGIEPFELITSSVEKVMLAARQYDPSKGGFDAYAGSQIFGGATGEARNALKPEQSGGTDDFWYNQLRSSIGENTVPTQFYTPGGSPLVGPTGLLNASAVVPYLDAGLPPTYMPASLTGSDVERYIAAKEAGLISGDPSVRRVEAGLRRLNSNLLGGRGDGDNSYIGANAQEADALSGALPETRGNLKDTIDALFHRESTQLDATDLARMNAEDRKQKWRRYNDNESDSEVVGNRSLFKTESMAQQADLADRNSALASADKQIGATAESVPQVAYQVQQMQERLTFGRVRPGFAKRFQANNPDLVARNRNQYNIAQNRLRALERPEQVIPAQPLRVSDAGNAAPPSGGQPPEPPDDTPFPDEEFPEPGRDPSSFHGQTSSRGFNVPKELSPSVHTRDAARMAMDNIKKEFPEFYDKYLGVAAGIQGDKNPVINQAHEWLGNLSDEQYGRFDSLWQTVMGEHNLLKNPDYNRAGFQSQWTEEVTWNHPKAIARRQELKRQFEAIKPPVSQPSAVVGAGDNVDTSFPAGTSWEEISTQRFHERGQVALDASQEEIAFNAGDTVTDAHVSGWRETAQGLSAASLGGVRSTKLGQFTPTEFNGRRITAGEYVLGSKVTASSDEVGVGLDVAREGILGALGQGGLAGMSGLSASATLSERFNRIINDQLKKYEEVASQTHDPTQVKESIQRIREVAKDVFESFGGEVRASTNYSGRPGDFQYTAARLNEQELQAAMGRYPGLRAQIEETSGSARAAAIGPAGIYTEEGVSIRYGEGAVWSSRGRGGRGGFGGGGSGGPGGTGGLLGDLLDDGALDRSPYQTPFGRMMMAQFMTSMAWQNTGGKVLDTAAAYGRSQAYMAPMAGFDTGYVGGAAGYSARMALSQEMIGETAYDQYGMFGEFGTALRAGPLGKYGNSALVGTGAGLVAGFLAGGPVGWGVGLTVAGSGIATSAINDARGDDAQSGLSWRNWLRASLARSALENKIDPTAEEKKFVATTIPALARGEDLDAFMATRPVDEETFFKRGNLGTFLDQYLPGVLESVSVTDSEKQASGLSEFNQEIAKKYGLDPKESAKELTALQVGMGGLETPLQKSLADKMVDLSLETGKDQLSLFGQYTSLRGIRPGSEDWQSSLQQWTGYETKAERDSLLVHQQKMAQAYSQFAPYLEGGTHSAAQLADQFGLGQMASAQAFAQVTSGFGMDYGRDMTDLEATGFAQMMQGQSPRLSMKLASVANSIAGFGSVSMTDAFSSLSGAVSRGVDANFLSELFSGNLYAISDVGQLTGQGNLQYYQSDGLRMGTTDISGVVRAAQQRLGLSDTAGTSEILGAMGLSFSSREAEDALTKGGLEGYETFYNNQRYNMQMQSFGIQQAQMAANENYMYTTWGTQDQITAQQYGSQMNQFDYSLRRMDLQHQFQLENWAAQDEQRQTGLEYDRWRQSFDYGTSLMQRDFTRENWDYQAQTQTLNFGWSMQDYDEAIRRSSGYERAQLIKKRDRATTSFNLNSQNADRTRDNQEELWAREDERYKKSLEYNEQMNDLNKENFDRQRAQAEQLYQMERENTVRRQDDAKELHKLQMQLQKEQRQHQQEQLEFSKQSLELQLQMAKSQHEYSENVRQFTQSREKDEAAMRKLIGYAPEFSRMTEDWIKLIDTMDRKASSLQTMSNVFNIAR